MQHPTPWRLVEVDPTDGHPRTYAVLDDEGHLVAGLVDQDAGQLLRLAPDLARSLDVVTGLAEELTEHIQFPRAVSAERWRGALDHARRLTIRVGVR